MFEERDPIRSGVPGDWDRLIDALDPPAMLLLIEGRLSASLRRASSAEDVWQESLLQAWHARDRCEWRGVGPFRNWLLTIVENRIRDLADRQGAIKRGGGTPAIAFSALDGSNGIGSQERLPRSTTPSRIAMQREQAEAMRAALGSLPEELRDVVRLRLVERLAIEEIATHLSIGPSAVRHRFRKGAELYAASLRRLIASGTNHGAARSRDSATAGELDSSPC